MSSPNNPIAARERLVSKFGEERVDSLLSAMALRVDLWSVQVQRNRSRAFRERIEEAQRLLNEAEKIALGLEPLSRSHAKRVHRFLDRPRGPTPKKVDPAKFERAFGEAIDKRLGLIRSACQAVDRVRTDVAEKLASLEAGQGNGPDFIVEFPNKGKRELSEILCAAAATAAHLWILENFRKLKAEGLRVTGVDLATAGIALGIEKTFGRRRWELRVKRAGTKRNKHPLHSLQRRSRTDKPPGRLDFQFTRPFGKYARALIEGATTDLPIDPLEVLSAYATFPDVLPTFDRMHQNRQMP